MSIIKRVLHITHRQWLYRNARIHIKIADGLTKPEHKNIIRLAYNLLDTDPNDLLPQHRYLLEEDFLQLGEGPSINRQYWIASMQSALDTVHIVVRKKRKKKKKASMMDEALTQHVQKKQKVK